MSTVSLVEQKMPAPMPERLHAHFEEYRNEYGGNAAEAEEMRFHRCWAIVEGDGQTVGYLWLDKHDGGEHPGLYRSIAIFREFQQNGFARFARIEAEKILLSEGCDAVLVQVNNARPDSGQLTRLSLLRNGFQLVDRPWQQMEYERMSDEDYSVRIHAPLVYRKQLQ